MARSSAEYDGGVPEVLPQRTIGPEPYQRIAAPADAFGAGIAQGAEQFGKGALDASSFYGQVAAQDAANKWESEANKILYGDPDVPGDRGQFGAVGQDALNGTPGTIQRLTDLREQIKAGLTTDDMQQRFDERTFRISHYYNQQIGAHYDREFKAYASATNKASGDLALQNIAANPDDDGLIAHSRERLRQSYVQEAQNRYGTSLSPDILQDTLARADRDAVAARIHALEDRDPPGALRLLNQNRAQLAALPQFPGWAHRLEERADQAGGEALANRVSSGASGDLWSRIKGIEGGIGRGGEALTSPKGAIGVSQILPETAQEMASDLGLPYDRQRLFTDQAYNERLGKAYLDKMLARYDGNQALAAAAYNAGPARVDAWLNTIGDPRKGEITDAEFAGRIPIGETRNYVGKIIAGTFRAPIESGPAEAPAPVAVGDSITGHLITFAGAGGKTDRTTLGTYRPGDTAVNGYKPEQILNTVIPGIPDEQIRGKPVILSTGASNDPAQLGAVPQQIAALKARGAASVTVLGVGTAATLAGVNDKLAQIAKDNGAAFAGPLQKVKDDGIHSADNPGLLAQARAAMPAAPAAAGDIRPPGRRSAEDQLQDQLRTIEADPNANQRQKDHAAAIVRQRFSREQAASLTANRQEAASVRQLMRDDEASLTATGQPVPELTQDRVAAALGPEAADAFTQNRQAMSGFWQQTHDFDTLPMADIRGRLDALRPAPGSAGFAQAQKIYEAADKKAEAIDRLRATDPAQAVMVMPELQKLQQGASLANPESYRDLVRSRKIAMDQIGIAPENRVPITRREAVQLWQPIGLAARAGDPGEIKSALTAAIDTVQRGFGEDADSALEMVLREGHADRETAGQAATLLKRLVRNQPATPAETRAAGQAAADAAAVRAAAPLATDLPGIPVGDMMFAVPMTAPPAPARRYPAPDAAAIEMLRQSPGTAAQFDQFYGPGAADKVLKLAPARGAGR